MVFKYAVFIAALLLSVSIPGIGFGQSITDPLKRDTTHLVLRNDTLFSDKGYKIFVGKQLVIGKGSGENGRYLSINFKSAAAFPLIFLRNAEIKNNIEYQADPSARDADKVKEYLTEGKSLIVKKIKLKGNTRNWHYYLVYLSDGPSSSAQKFKCSIAYALDLKELVVQE